MAASRSYEARPGVCPLPLLVGLALAAASMPTAAAGRPQADDLHSSIQVSSHSATSAVQLGVLSQVASHAAGAGTEDREPGVNEHAEAREPEVNEHTEKIGSAAQTWVTEVQELDKDIKELKAGKADGDWKGTEEFGKEADKWKGKFTELKGKAKDLRDEAVKYLNRLTAVAETMTSDSVKKVEASLTKVKAAKKEYDDHKKSNGKA